MSFTNLIAFLQQAQTDGKLSGIHSAQMLNGRILANGQLQQASHDNDLGDYRIRSTRDGKQMFIGGFSSHRTIEEVHPVIEEALKRAKEQSLPPKISVATEVHWNPEQFTTEAISHRQWHQLAACAMPEPRAPVLGYSGQGGLGLILRKHQGNGPFDPIYWSSLEFAIHFAKFAIPVMQALDCDSVDVQLSASDAETYLLRMPPKDKYEHERIRSNLASGAGEINISFYGRDGKAMHRIDAFEQVLGRSLATGSGSTIVGATRSYHEKEWSVAISHIKTAADIIQSMQALTDMNLRRFVNGYTELTRIKDTQAPKRAHFMGLALAYDRNDRDGSTIANSVHVHSTPWNKASLALFTQIETPLLLPVQEYVSAQMGYEFDY